MIKGINYSNDVKNFYIEHVSPRRKVSDLRTEFNNDAKLIGNTYGPVYVGFSSGVDCQIITRCFLDMKVDAEYVFMHVKNCNDNEYEHVVQCEKFYGIKIKKITLDLEDHKESWLEKRKKETVPSMHQYSFEWLSKQLPEDWPFVLQGAMEPYLVGTNNKNSGIIRNYFEDSLQRQRLMEQHRPVIDFPVTPESIASYYTDDIVQSFVHTTQYFKENDLFKDGKPLLKGQYWNYYCKPLVKGRYFKDDIIWFGKLTGYENFPLWLESEFYIKETAVSIPYWDLVKFLQKTDGSTKTYSEWHYGNVLGFKSLQDFK